MHPSRRQRDRHQWAQRRNGGTQRYCLASRSRLVKLFCARMSTQLARIRSLIWRASFSISSAFLTRERDKTSVSGVLSDSSFKSLTNCSKRSTSRLNVFWSSLSRALGSARGERGVSSAPVEPLASGIWVMGGRVCRWGWPPASRARDPASVAATPERKNLRPVFIGFSCDRILGGHPHLVANPRVL